MIVCSYILISINRPLIRMLEGYTFPLKSISSLKCRQIDRYKRLKKEIREIEESWDVLERGDPELFLDVQRKRSEKIQMLANHFPDKSDLILPTSFGNVIRAFEAYSRILYGIDSIPGWPRLIRVMDERDDEQINGSKALLDYYLNLFYLSNLILPLIVIRSFHDIHVLEGNIS